ncbi:hypothetical protein BC351_33165 [Paenibacillus ferrarius]|uniref:Integron cassette protein domain-containing protein n=1 Tax=Paenibacillus ferrarius TaxID=1469647 RepID=A0A1V4HE65_9BACL|nr:hypothetical protein [Paenibacillus ferrarius]OPH52185.1 hypothetical protein BC351_33165 [Paenibacillus ferrarius]
MSGVNLNQNQQEMRDAVERCLKMLRDDIRQGNKLPYDRKMEVYAEMAKAAHELHMSLDPKPKHHRYMIENRGVEPEHPEFYDHIHPAEDLIKYLDDKHANDDPEDQTLGHTFEFPVFSRRWGHKDSYKVTRNEQGWSFSFHKNEQGDKTGSPALYRFLDHDSINYPQELPGYLEWLWIQAEEQGLSHDEVQESINDLADWVSACESSTPRGVFRGFK